MVGYVLPYRHLRVEDKRTTVVNTERAELLKLVDRESYIIGVIRDLIIMILG